MITYDLHVHTCLSPDADDSMTPAAAVDRAVENGLDILAITDHNSVANLEAAATRAKNRIVFVPGIEVESAEEVHVICLFPTLEDASRMERFVEANMPLKQNKPRLFGNQIVTDEEGNVVDEESRLLSFPTEMTVEEIFYTARQLRGVAIYAHLDRSTYSVLSVLGRIPSRPKAKAVEFTSSPAGRKMAEDKGRQLECLKLFSSDAHHLEDMNTKETSEDLEPFADQLRDENGTITAANVIRWIRSYEVI